MRIKIEIVAGIVKPKYSINSPINVYSITSKESPNCHSIHMASNRLTTINASVHPSSSCHMLKMKKEPITKTACEIISRKVKYWPIMDMAVCAITF